MFGGLSKLIFCVHGMMKLMQNCVYFFQSYSVLYYPKVLKLHFSGAPTLASCKGSNPNIVGVTNLCQLSSGPLPVEQKRVQLLLISNRWFPLSFFHCSSQDNSTKCFALRRTDVGKVFKRFYCI